MFVCALRVDFVWRPNDSQNGCDFKNKSEMTITTTAANNNRKKRNNAIEILEKSITHVNHIHVNKSMSPESLEERKNNTKIRARTAVQDF